MLIHGLPIFHLRHIIFTYPSPGGQNCSLVPRKSYCKKCEHNCAYHEQRWLNFGTVIYSCVIIVTVFIAFNRKQVLCTVLLSLLSPKRDYFSICLRMFSNFFSFSKQLSQASPMSYVYDKAPSSHHFLDIDFVSVVAVYFLLIVSWVSYALSCCAQSSIVD